MLVENSGSLIMKLHREPPCVSTVLLAFDCFNKPHRILGGLFTAACLCISSLPGATTRETQVLFDFDWRFHRGDLEDAASETLDDREWRWVQLPHDWSIEDLPPDPVAYDAPGVTGASVTDTRVVSGPFDSASLPGLQTGFTVGGIAWYRKHFSTPVTDSTHILRLKFEGVYEKAHVWLNGHFLGEHVYGYTGFAFDLNAFLNPEGIDNVIAVRVENTGKNSRWYAGSGIYRHVWLEQIPSTHLLADATVVTTPEVGDEQATIQVRTLVGAGDPLPVSDEHGPNCTLAVYSPENEKILETGMQALREDEALGFAASVTLSNPKLWSLETPSLYRAVVTLVQDGIQLDCVSTAFGIRSITFDTERGFQLNGEPVLIKGGCVHGDNGPLGAAAFDRAEERKVELLKAAGFNAIRDAHNPRSPAVLDACDRLGMLVIEEAFDTWEMAKVPDDFHVNFPTHWKTELEATIRNAINHPSVILWSIGNQIRNGSTPEGARWSRILADHVRTLDPTRPVTANVYHWGKEWSLYDPYFEPLDLAGYSYGIQFYEADHARLPERIILGTETHPRRIFDYWMMVRDHAYVLGDFSWTAMDYLGEAGLGWWSYGHPDSEIWPWNQTYSGDIDIVGNRRARSFYREVLWSDVKQVYPVVHPPEPSFSGGAYSNWGWDDVVASWNWSGHEGEMLKVDVYSNCSHVRLVFNGETLGEQENSRENRYITTWEVPFAAGQLEAVGLEAGSEVARSILQTAGIPRGFRVQADRTEIGADGQDLSFVSIEIIDADGNWVSNASLPVNVTLEGAGTLAALGNGDPTSIESFQQPVRKCFEGRLLAVVRADRIPGETVLRVSAEGLLDASIRIRHQTAVKE